MKKFILALVLLASCAVVPTKKNLYENLIACTKTQAAQELRDKAVQCLLTSNSNNYAACLEPLAVTWTTDEIECVAAYYEQSTKSDGGTQ
jgi:hypothetical protein